MYQNYFTDSITLTLYIFKQNDDENTDSCDEICDSIDIQEHAIKEEPQEHGNNKFWNEYMSNKLVF